MLIKLRTIWWWDFFYIEGRAGDLNSHYLHHDKGRGKNVNFNYSL
jgi:hypothetical protein